MPNATLEKTGSERGDNECDQQEQGFLSEEEGDSHAGSPRQGSSSTDMDKYDCEGNDDDIVAPSGGVSGNNNQGNKIELSSLREHDYIGLSDGGSSATTQEEKTKGKDLDLGPNTRETELRLGPPQEPSSFQNGASKNKTTPGGVPAHPNMPDGGMITSAAIPPVDEGRPGKPYALNDSHLQRWNRQCFGEQQAAATHVGGKYVYPKQALVPKEPPEPKFFNNGHEVHPQVQDYNINNGMSFLLTPKNTSVTLTAGAKRVFSDAMGAAQLVRGAFNIGNEGSRIGLDSKISGQNQSHPSLGAVYPWPNSVQVPNTWQPSLEQHQQHRGGFGAFPTTRVMVGNMMTGNVSMKEAPHGTISESHARSLQDTTQPGMKPPMAPPPPSEPQQKNPTLSQSNENGNSRAAPVVGWPPIRSFRRNLAPQPKPDTEGQTHASDSSVAAAAADRVQAFGDSMFVKVNMDGVPIGRKIDLNAYDSYEKLSHALEEMFKRFVNAQGIVRRLTTNPSSENDQPLIGGTDYVLTYEDNEGDRMLVGDVPWEMFVTTVKRLRIMKSSEARGLAAPRQPPKPQGQMTQ